MNSKNLLKYFLFFIVLVDSKIIKNANLPACRNCIHYKPPFLSDFDSSFSKCEYFGTKNIQTDKISYDYADSCRNDEKKCGQDGIYFKKEDNIFFKLLVHNLKNLSPILFTILLGIGAGLTLFLIN